MGWRSEHGRLLQDGRPRLVLAGEIHYFRLPRERWAPVIDLLARAGADTVASYIPWLWHELADGSLDLTGRSRPERDLGAFIDLCAEAGLDFLARPGPFQMAELKNEGIPYRIRREHPEIAPLGWDAKPAPGDDVDLLAPAFLAEVGRWFDAVLPVLAARQPSAGGRLNAVQLDNEVGMLSWVTNTPVLTDLALAQFDAFLEDRGHRDRYPRQDWGRVVRSPDEEWAGPLRVDLADFARHRHAAYLEWLAARVRAAGLTEVPLLVNVHGTSGGNGVPFGIGVSQLAETWRAGAQVLPGSDHYLGELTRDSIVDLHFISAALQAAAPDRTITSLEFEAGTGDYGEGSEELHDPATVGVKSQLMAAQGNRLINYYLFAGGTNPALDAPVGDGNDRIGFTGLRHGTAAPVGPDGEAGVSYRSTADAIAGLRAEEAHLAEAVAEHDDLAIGWSASAFATEHRYPLSTVMADIVADLEAHRGPGPRKALHRALLHTGHRFGMVDVEDPGSTLPGTLLMSGGRVVAETVQRRLVEHARSGATVVWLGRLPDLDVTGGHCDLMADAAGVTLLERVSAGPHHHPSVRGSEAWPELSEVRVGWYESWRAPAGSTVLMESVTGDICGLEVPIGAGRLVLLGAELNGRAAPWRGLFDRLGLVNGLGFETDIDGVLALTTRSSGRRMLHVFNPTGYPARVRAAGVQVEVGPRSVELVDLPL